MKIAILKEEMPFRYKGIYTFYKPGEEFIIIEEKEMPLIGLCYKVMKYGCILEGHTKADCFIIKILGEKK